MEKTKGKKVGMIKQTFITITEPSDTITIDSALEKILREGMQPILWNRDGVSHLIPVGILMNALDSIDTQKKLLQFSCSVKITWDQGYLIPDDIGIILQSGTPTKYSKPGVVKYVKKEKNV